MEYRVVIFKQGSIGDCLMGKYLLENVRATHPAARCCVVVGTRGAMIRDLFASYPWIEVVEANRKSPLSILFLLRNFWRSDLVVTQYTGGKIALFAKLFARLLAHSGGLVGYTDSSKLNRFIYDSLIEIRGRVGSPRLLEVDALVAARIPVSITYPIFAYIHQPNLLSKLGLEPKKYVVLHLFSGGNARGLSPARKITLIEALFATLPNGVRLVLTGTHREHLELGGLPDGVLFADTTLQELAHLIDHSVVMVSLDTGAAHIAAHLHKSLIVLVSCRGVQWWNKDMYGVGIPSAIFTRKEACGDVHNYTGYAPCLDAIDMGAVASRATAFILQG